MKKILMYFITCLLLFFIIPALCTIVPPKEQVQEVISTSEIQKNNKEPQEIENQEYDYQKYKTVKLLHQRTGDIEEINIDEYLYGVVSSEMPASYELEALKAQATVARTYTIYQIIYNSGKHENADICDDFNCCQAWISKEDRLAKWSAEEAENNWNRIVQAVDETEGKAIVYDGKVINAFFHANSGGITESSLNIWGGIDYPYLKSVETSGEEAYTQYASKVVLSHKELLDKISSKYGDCTINFEEKDCIKIIEYTTSNRVKTIKFGNKEISGTEARSILGLKSTNFTFLIDEKNVIFSVTGYGHGVGMSQTGADSLAKLGANYESIIKHFYTNVEIVEVNSL